MYRRRNFLLGLQPNPKELHVTYKTQALYHLGTWISNMETNKMATVSPTEAPIWMELEAG